MAAIAAEATPVRWFVLNAAAIVEIDITAADVLQEFQRELTANGIVFAMARTKQDLYQQLSRTGFVDRVGPERFYPTLPEAIAAFRREVGERVG